MESILPPNSSLLAHENCKEKKNPQSHSVLFVISRTLTAGCLIYIGILIYPLLCTKNKGNFGKSFLWLNWKERKKGIEKWENTSPLLTFLRHLEKKEQSESFPVASVQGIIDIPLHLGTEGAEVQSCLWSKCMGYQSEPKRNFLKLLLLQHPWTSVSSSYFIDNVCPCPELKCLALLIWNTH